MNGNGRKVALWAGVASFFGSLLAIGAIDVLNPDQALQFAGSLIVAVITAGAVYSRERLNDAKEDKQKRDQASRAKRK